MTNQVSLKSSSVPRHDINYRTSKLPEGGPSEKRMVKQNKFAKVAAPKKMPEKFEKAASCCTCRRFYSGDEALTSEIAQAKADLKTVRETKTTMVTRLKNALEERERQLHNRTVDLEQEKKRSEALQVALDKANLLLQVYEEEDKALEELLEKKKRRKVNV